MPACSPAKRQAGGVPISPHLRLDFTPSQQHFAIPTTSIRATMSLESAFRQLAIRPSSLCRQCRRTFVSSTRRPEQPKGATAAFAGEIHAARQERAVINKCNRELHPANRAKDRPITSTILDSRPSRSRTSTVQLVRHRVRDHQGIHSQTPRIRQPKSTRRTSTSSLHARSRATAAS